ncbi:hypothetical protein Tco_1019161 [Tanacetum coccineum]|uniref:Uncharacterized protein n=1 Tax=Tanacetum coccineum TaxID=301880 RepID=A0ABQ5FWB6_9ASTR
MTTAFSKKLKTGDVEVDVEAPSQDVSREKEATVKDVEVPSNIASKAQQTASSLKKVGTKKKLLGRKVVHTSQSTIPMEEGDPDAEHKLCIKYASDEDSASDCDTPIHLYVVVDWELLPTGLGPINAIYRLDNSRKYFTSLREILHLDKKAEGVGLVLWGDLKILMDSPEVNDDMCRSFMCSSQDSSRLDVAVKFIFQSSRYVVPTGRVVVPTGRYVVPAGKVIIIVSPGRLNLVPTGRILSPGKVK